MKTNNPLPTALSTFMFCYDADIEDLKKSRWRTKVHKTESDFFTRKELARLKLTIAMLDLREQAILFFLVSSGCRISELAALTLEDIDLDKRTASVSRKGERKWMVPISEECAALLEEYLDARTNDSPSLFLDKQGHRITPEGIYRIARKVGKRAMLVMRFSPHLLRRIFVADLLARRAELIFVGKKLVKKTPTTPEHTPIRC
ncbi:tyrosine-type recombinase/integrase [Heliobacterium mobile]|nr:tyrosine-type recombinase/integrase [Heliobacterium mobile]